MRAFGEAPMQVGCLVLLSLIVRCTGEFMTSLYCEVERFLVNIKFVFWFACGVLRKTEVESIILVSVGNVGGDTRSHPLTKGSMLL